MTLDFKCCKCGSTKYFVKTAVLPEKDSKLKIELGTYYLKVCANCGYTEMYSAKIVNADKSEAKENEKVKSKGKLEPTS